jgi:FkbM family methyltransferase
LPATRQFLPAGMSLTLEQYESLNPRCEIEHAGIRMVFATPSVMTRSRVETIHHKEPWTLEWIAGFRTGEILIDIGANVGMYSIWAAATRKSRVFAFEPEAQNYALLNRNIQANRLEMLVKAYCAGLGDHLGLTDLHMVDMRIGGSNHAMGQALNFKREPMQAVYRQGCVALRLDDLVSSGAIPQPQHIKIDVDGFEPKVISGSAAVLKNPALRSLLIEVNLSIPDHGEMVSYLGGFGFKYDSNQVSRATRQGGMFKGVAEYVFTR